MRSDMIIKGTRQEHILERLKQLEVVARYGAPMPILELGIKCLLIRTHGSVWKAIYLLARGEVSSWLHRLRSDFYEGWLRYVRLKTEDEIHVALFGFSESELDEAEDEEEWPGVIA